ncbi:uncharacterized protein BO80DRAFT_358182 [Aspergillus ibericus CBS 121593]|uniref:Trafficking protein particle complex subunit 12 n=1 Tax=Aspergillus ibericus CBS 121593 TaxID=1448316 RepID=A0A395GW49_9EURO|nr:hypothetical protein BO80DRAFT_358182 [Aspergillus ibericus CBS 121593]RAK99735.1 hypothetical protein BO80DRAFT_358182 [Aspergillus ibericus CBS 121593]
MEAPASKHTRNISRSSRPRSSTKGPLDQPDDPLGSGAVNTSASPTSSTAEDGGFTGASFNNLDPLGPDELPPTLEKDLGYLLRYDVYHSLSQIEIPHALRSEFLAPTSDESLSTSLATLERLLAEGHFLLAAYLCGTILTSSLISPTDIKRIFSLFYTRLACLQLSGNTIIAAQESKALEDLSSAFYYVEPISEPSENHTSYPRHIVPWPLRVLAIRLQSIGFGDSRRGIGGLYEIGLEARREILRPDLAPHERNIWRERLSDLGMRNVNALIEMGDLDAARRSLGILRMSEPESETTTMRKALLLLLIGDLDAARQLCGGASDAGNTVFSPLLSMADGRYDDAVVEWRALIGNENQRPDEAMISQNLAVCLLYTGRLNEAREVLESLVQANHSFSSLVFNLSTVYELCSDKSAKLKTDLVETVAKQPVTGATNLDRPNGDFKL